MPINGHNDAAIFADLHEHALGWLGECEWFDAHTHIGRNDPDGMTAEPEDLVAAMDEAGHRAALLFAMHEPSGYSEANDRILAVCQDSEDRFTALGRVDPNSEGALAEARRCLDAGAAGIKLHPRSDGFTLDHPRVQPVVELVAQRRGIVLFHAGRGIPRLGEHAAGLARAQPDASIVLAHAGISDLGVLAADALELPNLFFDTAWWHPSDLIALFTTIPPGRILYGSDMPYGPPGFTAAATLRCARVAGLQPAVVREIAGGQLRRILAGAEPADLGPAPGSAGLGQRVIALERVLSYSVTAVQMAFRGGDPTEALALARLGCQIADDGDAHVAAVLADADRRLEHAQGALARTGDGEAAATGAMAAGLVAATAAAGVPATA